MSIKLHKFIFWIIALIILLAGLYYTFREQAYSVDVAYIEVGPLQVSITEEGETRVRDIFELSSPLMGRVLRLDLEAGDDVKAAETIVANIEPSDPTFLDIRSEEEAKAAVHAAEAMLRLAKAKLNEAESELEFSLSELERTQRLIDRRLVAQRELDRARKNFKTKSASVETAIASIKARESELAQAKARLVTPVNIRGSNKKCNCLPIYSPTTGKILRILHESEGVVQPGDVLVEIGDTNDLEIVVDFISIDAVQIKPGQAVIIQEWGGETYLDGVVKKVEPFGYTKVSSLGIEEQRVDVIIDFIGAKDKLSSLGHGYQVEVKVILWEDDNILKVPVTSLFRESDEWSLFVVENKHAILKNVQIGKMNSFEAQIITGVVEGEKVILHPGNEIKNGSLVTERNI
jgi:HlyD family secretion protein